MVVHSSNLVATLCGETTLWKTDPAVFKTRAMSFYFQSSANAANPSYRGYEFKYSCSEAVVPVAVVPPSTFTAPTGTIHEPHINNAGQTASLTQNTEGVQYITCPTGTTVSGSFSLFDVGKKDAGYSLDSGTSTAVPGYSFQNTGCRYSMVQIFRTNQGKVV